MYANTLNNNNMKRQNDRVSGPVNLLACNARARAQERVNYRNCASEMENGQNSAMNNFAL